MACYDYRCDRCGATFEVEEPMSEHEGEATPECPECGGRETRQLMSDFFPDTSDKT